MNQQEKRIRAVVSDFDGTIFDISTHRVPPTWSELVTQLNSHGVEFVIATARHWDSFFKAKGDLNCDCIASSGAEIRNFEGQLIEQTPIDHELVEEVVSAFVKAGLGVQILLSKDRQRFARTPDYKPGRLFENFNRGMFLDGDYRKYISDYRVLQIDSLGILDEDLALAVLEIAGNNTSIRWDLYREKTFGGGFNLTASSSRSSKWLAAVRYYNSKGIAADEICAIGDGANDAEMLRNASLGIAINNACKEAQEAADVILTADQTFGDLGTIIQAFNNGIMPDHNKQLVPQSQSVEMTDASLDIAPIAI